MAQGKGIFKRPHSRNWWIAVADVTGRIVRESTGTAVYLAALKKLAERREAVSKGKRIEQPKIRNAGFADAADEYLKWAKPQRAHRNKEYMKAALLERFGNTPLHRFSVSMLETYQQDLLSQGKSPATINRRMSMMKHLFHKCNDWGMVDDDTLRRVRKVKQLKEPPGRLRYLSAPGVHRLLKECGTPRLRAIVAVAVYTGMRRGEILSLKWPQVDLRNGFILIEQTKNGERREVPINAAVREVLTGIVRRLDQKYVFEEKGGPMKCVRHAFDRACRKAGIYNFRFHDLRHTAASFMAMAGIDLLSIGKILGHKTIGMTKRYSHLSPGHLRNAVDAIDQAMTAPEGSTSRFTSRSADFYSHAVEGTA